MRLGYNECKRTRGMVVVVGPEPEIDGRGRAAFRSRDIRHN